MHVEPLSGGPINDPSCTVLQLPSQRNRQSAQRRVRSDAGRVDIEERRKSILLSPGKEFRRLYIRDNCHGLFRRKRFALERIKELAPGVKRRTGLARLGDLSGVSHSHIPSRVGDTSLRTAQYAWASSVVFATSHA